MSVSVCQKDSKCLIRNPSIVLIQIHKNIIIFNSKLLINEITLVCFSNVVRN